jgi:acyl-CoA synthetase (AMP-forming)/AMP-acid ligase II
MVEPPRSRTLGKLLDEIAAKYPTREAIIFEGQRITYKEFR